MNHAKWLGAPRVVSADSRVPSLAYECVISIFKHRTRERPKGCAIRNAGITYKSKMMKLVKWSILVFVMPRCRDHSYSLLATIVNFG
jgi:hypothetical protein